KNRGLARRRASNQRAVAALEKRVQHAYERMEKSRINCGECAGVVGEGEPCNVASFPGTARVEYADISINRTQMTSPCGIAPSGSLSCSPLAVLWHRMPSRHNS